MDRDNRADRKPDTGSATDGATAYRHALKLAAEGTYAKALPVSVRRCKSPPPSSNLPKMNPSINLPIGRSANSLYLE